MRDRQKGEHRFRDRLPSSLDHHDHGPAPDVSDGTTRAARWVRWFVLATVRLVTRMFSRGRPRVFGDVPAEPCLVVFHHNSPLDAIIIAHPFGKAGHHPIAMVKAGVFRHRLSGPLVRTAGMIPVARGAAEGRAEAYDAAVRHLGVGHTVFVAPSGTLSQTQVVEPDLWRIGAVRMAAEAGVKIVPALSIGPHRWGGNGRQPLKFHRVPVDIWIGDAVDVAEDPEVATRQLADVVSEMLDHAYDEYPDPGPGKWWWPASRGGTATDPSAEAA